MVLRNLLNDGLIRLCDSEFVVRLCSPKSFSDARAISSHTDAKDSIEKMVGVVTIR